MSLEALLRVYPTHSKKRTFASSYHGGSGRESRDAHVAL